MERIGSDSRRSSTAAPSIGRTPAWRRRCSCGTPPQGVVCDAVPDVAQAVGLFAHELMMGDRGPPGVTAMYSVPEPQPEIRL